MAFTKIKTLPTAKRQRTVFWTENMESNTSHFKVTLVLIWKYANILVFMWKWYVEDFTSKQLLLYEICACEICEKFVYKDSETIE